ncbi:MAG: GDSL-type esterase/lipase family protein [bacterium]|nr:GDSL-type esterase/lipase family protein [bacterium]
MKWVAFPEGGFEVRGLAWFDENAPELWRLPGRAATLVREPVWNLARYPAGGRIRFRSSTTALDIRTVNTEFYTRTNMSAIGTRGLDVYVDGQYWNSVCARDTGEQEQIFFEGAEGEEKEITIYLPLYHEMQVLALGIDEEADVETPVSFERDRPVVFYGSSVAQGAGACRSGMTYEAILGRMLNLDFVDLGFGGNGRAEPEMVELISGMEACCFVFDLGKSYGHQPASVYTRMLEAVREAHPNVPLVCMTPIFSTREFFDQKYREISLHTRQVVIEAVGERHCAGDDGVYLVDGLDLLGAEDADGFGEGVHPTDYGFRLIAERLAPMVRRVLDHSKKSYPNG